MTKTHYTIAIIAANALLMGYIHGYRIANYSEVGASARPAGIVTTAWVDDLGQVYAKNQ